MMTCLVSRTGRELQRYNMGRRQVVGCVPYRYKDGSDGVVSNELEVLVITSQKGNAFMFPKGGWELDESVEEAASRESLEEAGVLGNVECQLGKWCFMSKSQETYYEGYMFPLFVKEQLDLWPEKNVRQRVWMTAAKAREACQHWWMKEALDILVERLTSEQKQGEENVCSSCNLRGDCERAYVKAREDEGGRTVDVMRFLLTYGLDPTTGTVENKPCLNKMVKESVRRLLKQMVVDSTQNIDSNPPKSTSTTIKRVASVSDHSIPQEKGQINVPMKPGDWLCPKCNFLNFARNIKCLRCDDFSQERQTRLREDQDHLPLKKGDWICDKCHFLNFAKNGRCLQCKEKPPKRQINPGEWECDSCNYINFKRNMVCLKCDHKRPKAAHSSEASAEPVHDNGSYPRTKSLSSPHTTETSQYGRSRTRGADKWRFVNEEEDDCNRSNSWNEASGLVDFPIAGGRTELSQNPKKRDLWKLKMLERSKGALTNKANNNESSVNIPKRLELSDSTDDEEMSEWFGDGKLETPRLPSLVLVFYPALVFPTPPRSLCCLPFLAMFLGNFPELLSDGWLLSRRLSLVDGCAQVAYVEARSLFVYRNKVGISLLCKCVF
ncbi:hypothetical protein D8674_037024 [Pyrus ussuriensis x Pyrus communis]|uniref:Uncharacterized protein n=1 Tax=Pyrus ussuriensis x Pyrus communis TaxID=2448454 RepID=A0A5N5HA85_9ROSA|nr:hypothetical protein D8674_037024 [Pyrus ussuriensis x Pyrus communis]